MQVSDIAKKAAESIERGNVHGRPAALVIEQAIVAAMLLAVQQESPDDCDLCGTRLNMSYFKIYRSPGDTGMSAFFLCPRCNDMRRTMLMSEAERQQH